MRSFDILLGYLLVEAWNLQASQLELKKNI
jgi:hypothetical protein